MWWKFFSDMRQVSGFLQVLWCPPPTKLTTTIQGSQNVPATTISQATSGWAPSTNLSKIKIEVGKTEMLSRYLLFPRSLLWFHSALENNRSLLIFLNRCNLWPQNVLLIADFDSESSRNWNVLEVTDFR